MTTKFDFGTKISGERLAKIVALAKQGIGGEKKNAEEIIQRLLAENKITVADIGESAEETKQLYTLKWEDENSKYILFMLVKKLIDDDLSNIKIYMYHGNSKKVDMMLAPSKYVELVYHYDLYCEEMKKELQAVFTAFIFKNKLYNESTGKRNPNAKEMPQEDIDRIVKHMKGIDPLNVRKALTA